VNLDVECKLVNLYGSTNSLMLEMSSIKLFELCPMELTKEKRLFDTENGTLIDIRYLVSSKRSLNETSSFNCYTADRLRVNGSA